MVICLFVTIMVNLLMILKRTAKNGVGMRLGIKELHTVYRHNILIWHREYKPVMKTKLEKIYETKEPELYKSLYRHSRWSITVGHDGTHLIGDDPSRPDAVCTYDHWLVVDSDPHGTAERIIESYRTPNGGKP